MYFGGVLEKHLGPRLATLIGGAVLSLGVGLSYFSIQSYWTFLVTYGFVFGVGMGVSSCQWTAVSLSGQFFSLLSTISENLVFQRASFLQRLTPLFPTARFSWRTRHHLWPLVASSRRKQGS
jgi:hypothetical protein